LLRHCAHGLVVAGRVIYFESKVRAKKVWGFVHPKLARHVPMHWLRDDWTHSLYNIIPEENRLLLRTETGIRMHQVEALP
jgi:hypothetical protein